MEVVCRWSMYARKERRRREARPGSQFTLRIEAAQSHPPNSLINQSINRNAAAGPAPRKTRTDTIFLGFCLG